MDFVGKNLNLIISILHVDCRACQNMIFQKAVFSVPKKKQPDDQKKDKKFNSNKVNHKLNQNSKKIVKRQSKISATLPSPSEQPFTPNLSQQTPRDVSKIKVNSPIPSTTELPKLSDNDTNANENNFPGLQSQGSPSLPQLPSEAPQV